MDLGLAKPWMASVVGLDGPGAGEALDGFGGRPAGPGAGEALDGFGGGLAGPGAGEAWDGLGGRLAGRGFFQRAIGPAVNTAGMARSSGWSPTSWLTSGMAL